MSCNTFTALFAFSQRGFGKRYLYNSEWCGGCWCVYVTMWLSGWVMSSRRPLHNFSRPRPCVLITAGGDAQAAASSRRKRGAEALLPNRHGAVNKCIWRTEYQVSIIISQSRRDLEPIPAIYTGLPSLSPCHLSDRKKSI